MLVVETIARIRRDHLVKGVPIKKIARDLRGSNNTVRKVVRGDETSFSYERNIQADAEAWAVVEELERQLEANEKKERRGSAVSAADSIRQTSDRSGSISTSRSHGRRRYRARIADLRPVSATRVANIHHHREADDLGRTVEVAERIVHRRSYETLLFGSSRFALMVWTLPFRRRVRQNGVWFELQTEGASMDITTIGFDLAKTVFQVHGADGEGRAVLRRKLRRGKVLAFFAGLPSCLVGMEACASAHYWAREIQALGHEVRLIPPQYVRPFVKTNKNGAADAEAICEAVTRPTMRFAPAKGAEQQSVLMLHRARELLVRQRTMVINALRGHCAELGLIVAQGALEGGGTGCHHRRSR